MQFFRGPWLNFFAERGQYYGFWRTVSFEVINSHGTNIVVENEDVVGAAPTARCSNYIWVINNLIAH